MTQIGVRIVAVVAAAHLLTSCVVAAGSSSRSDGSGSSFLFLLMPLALVMLMVGMARRRLRSVGGGRGRSSRGASRSFAEHDETTNEQVLRAELSVLADDVIRLEPQVALNDEARDDYEAATHRYRVAQAAMDYADEAVDLVRVQRVVDEANWAMSRARAILQGRTPPAPPAPLQRPGQHGEPAVRVDDRHRPVYVDSPAGFQSGWFSTGGGLFGGLLLGSMFGGVGGAWVQEHTDEGDDVDPEASDW